MCWNRLALLDAQLPAGAKINARNCKTRKELNNYMITKGEMQLLAALLPAGWWFMCVPYFFPAKVGHFD